MIRLPQRSVTRFFIPLIDVLTLLFCIFLLLPLVKEEDSDADRANLEEQLRAKERELAELRRKGDQLPKELQDQVEALRKQTGKALQERLAVRVLEIDPKNGKLFYRDPERVEVSSEAVARELVDRDRRESGGGKRELYYLILYPRDRASPYPTRGQREQYDRWFAGVALGYDIPGKGPDQR
jgi:hypothetical protein